MRTGIISNFASVPPTLMCTATRARPGLATKLSARREPSLPAPTIQMLSKRSVSRLLSCATPCPSSCCHETSVSSASAPLSRFRLTPIAKVPLQRMSIINLSLIAIQRHDRNGRVWPQRCRCWQSFGERAAKLTRADINAETQPLNTEKCHLFNRHIPHNNQKWYTP